MTLLTLASKEVWPQILAILHYKPSKVVFFHSSEEKVSKGPAQRLKQFLITSSILTEECITLRECSHDNFSEVIECFSTIAESLLLDEGNSQVNLTGGNKLMSMAAAEWARLNGTSCFYLELGKQEFIEFEIAAGQLKFKSASKTDAAETAGLSALELIRCQLHGADISNPGQRLTLSAKGKDLNPHAIQDWITQGRDCLKLVEWDVPEPKVEAGFNLEYGVAAMLLKLGIPHAQRSICLRPNKATSNRQDEGEIDLAFAHDNKLWIVDCKDKTNDDDLANRFESNYCRAAVFDSHIAEDYQRIREILAEKSLKTLKEDALSALELGGIRAEVICVRKERMGGESNAYAASRGLKVILKKDLLRDLQSILKLKLL